MPSYCPPPPSAPSIPLPSFLSLYSTVHIIQPLDTVDFNEPISPSLERRVLTTMISICESYLEQYPTKVEDDEALMMNRSLYGTTLKLTPKDSCYFLKAYKCLLRLLGTTFWSLSLSSSLSLTLSLSIQLTTILLSPIFLSPLHLPD